MLILIGISLVFVGILIVIAGIMLGGLQGIQGKEKTSVSGAGVIMIGPIPILFGDKRMLLPLIILIIILIVLWLFLFNKSFK